MTTSSGFLETNGARIYHEVDGSGEPLILVHAGVANLRMWDAQVASLRDAYRVIRYDTRGYGRTETDAVEFSNRADLAAVLDHLESSEGKDELIRLGEDIRLEAITFDQSLLRLRDERIERIGRSRFEQVLPDILRKPVR